MELQALSIRTRHFFGFLVPGVLWLGIGYYFIKMMTGAERFSPLDDAGITGTAERLIVLLGAAYLLGFGLQTMLWPLLVDRVKQKTQVPDACPGLYLAAERVIDHEIMPDVRSLPRAEIPHVCKLYVLEKSSVLRSVVLEAEDDLNFIAAYLIPGPALAGLYCWSRFTSITGRAVTLAAVIGAWWWIHQQLRRYLEHEYRDWFATFLILRHIEKAQAHQAIENLPDQRPV